MLDPQTLLDFWFSPSSRERWFQSTPEFDSQCQDRFGDWIEAAAAGRLDHWQEHAQGALAAILLLDQLPRNVFRGSARAFAFDAQALEIAKRAVDRGFDQVLELPHRIFIYLPFEHSEDLTDQNRSVELFRATGNATTLDYAIRHQVIIERFGRFPHRNAILGRTSTAQEEAFLQEPNSSF